MLYSELVLLSLHLRCFCHFHFVKFLFALKPDHTKSALHPRNRHRSRYDFAALIHAHAALAPYVLVNPFGDTSIDFANPQAVKALNQALLKTHYAVAEWDIPEHYLCPPIPGRADYVHYLADLLAESHAGNIPQGHAVRVLDIGTGANMVYPLIGTREYGWQFVAADIDVAALHNAQQIVDANGLAEVIALRLQTTPAAIFKGIIQSGETYALTMCNPPFHSSLEEAQAGSQRKLRGLDKSRTGKSPAKGASHAKPAALNFGGQSHELYCAGGEEAFVVNMIKESQQFAMQCQWFTTLVSKATTLPSVYRALKKVNARQVRTIAMAQGQKQSRFVAWTWR